MKIDGNNPVSPLRGGTARADRKSPAGPASAGTSAAGPDRVEVSPAALEFQAIRQAALQAPETRVDLVRALQERISAGAYEPSDREIAERMLEELGDGLRL